MNNEHMTLSELKRCHQMEWTMTRVALIRMIPAIGLIGAIIYLWQ